MTRIERIHALLHHGIDQRPSSQPRMTRIERIHAGYTTDATNARPPDHR
jgi:hypothetical protein